MGKFRMSHGKTTKPSTVVENKEIWNTDPGLHYATRTEVQEAMQSVMERHKATFEALAKHETIEKQEIIQVTAKSDNWARKHSIESRKQIQKSIKNLEYKCIDSDENLDVRISRLHTRVCELESRKPEEKQVVKEITVMKNEIPKSIWIGMGILLILNILTIMIK